MPENLSLFQNWTLFNLFRMPGQYFTKNDLMINCCDTALDDLDETKLDPEIVHLKDRGLVEHNGSGGFRITPTGILYVRKNMIKPLITLVESGKIGVVTNSVGTPVAKEIESIAYDTTADQQIDKPTFTKKIVDLAIQNVGPVMNVVSAAIKFIGS